MPAIWLLACLGWEVLKRSKSNKKKKKRCWGMPTELTWEVSMQSTGTSRGRGFFLVKPRIWSMWARAHPSIHPSTAKKLESSQGFQGSPRSDQSDVGSRGGGANPLGLSTFQLPPCAIAQRESSCPCWLTSRLKRSTSQPVWWVVDPVCSTIIALSGGTMSAGVAGLENKCGYSYT